MANKKLITAIFLFLFLPGFSQSKLGEVACVYVTSPNLDSSVALYEKIGFPKIASNIIPVQWAQVSDGSLIIMMRQDTAQYVGLTYYGTDIEKLVTQLEKDGIQFTQNQKKLIRSKDIILYHLMD